MTSWISRSINAIRAFLFGGDIGQSRLTPEHGWLLPPKAPVAVRPASRTPNPRG